MEVERLQSHLPPLRGGLRATWKLHVVAEKGAPLGNTVALDDIYDRILAQPESVAYFPVRLAFADKL